MWDKTQILYISAYFRQRACSTPNTSRYVRLAHLAGDRLYQTQILGLARHFGDPIDTLYDWVLKVKM